jgi:hypothetical protein
MWGGLLGCDPLSSGSRRLKSRLRAGLPAPRAGCQILTGTHTRLAPTSFDQDPAAVTMDPVMLYPASAAPGRHFPPPGDPAVCGTVPTMVAADPDVPRTWGDWTPFDNGRGWRHPNYHLRSSGAQGERCSKYYCDECSTHSFLQKKRRGKGLGSLQGAALNTLMMRVER